MTTAYPAGIDSWSNPGPTTKQDDTGFEHDVVHGNLNDAVEAIEAELGTDPAGPQATVKARLAYATQQLSPTFTSVWLSGEYAGTPRTSATPSTNPGSANTLYFQPWLCPFDVTVDRMAVEVVSPQASANARLGVYTAGSDGTPDSLVFEAGEIDCSSGAVKELTISQSLTGGVLYWLARANETAAVTYRADSGGNPRSFGSTTTAATASPIALSIAHTYGALPSSAGSFTSMTRLTTAAVYVWFRRA